MDDYIHICKRENNSRRGYLIVNSLQGKHVPVSPQAALNLFGKLGDALAERFCGERLLAIGFAETATAIGAAVAIRLGCHYIQTTREDMGPGEFLYFSEEHSHATEQKIAAEELDGLMGSIDRVLFIEDEITTGKTILNGIRAMERRYGRGLHFGAASLLNGMTEEDEARFRQAGVDWLFLRKLDNAGYEEAAARLETDGFWVEQTAPGELETIEIGGRLEPRRLVDSRAYAAGCQDLARRAIELAEVKPGQRVLVLGTEECMFPAIFLGAKLETLGAQVWTHSTTRSPIAPSQGCPLWARYRLRSLYDAERTTFIYNLAQYDRVLIVTDAAPLSREGAMDLAGALGQAGNRQIRLIQWREA